MTPISCHMALQVSWRGNSRWEGIGCRIRQAEACPTFHDRLKPVLLSSDGRAEQDWACSSRISHATRCLGVALLGKLRRRQRLGGASTRLPNGIQLDYGISRVHRYSACTADVVFDRAPVDSIACSLSTANQRTTDIDLAFVETPVPAVRESPDHLDILAFMPITDARRHIFIFRNPRRRSGL